MTTLLLALRFITKYNRMPLDELVKEFEEYTEQTVPEEAVSNFKLIGLNNIDFVTSDYLNSYDLKNLFQYVNLKEENEKEAKGE
jgi:hypothetical protein